jgi:hypothetical protein
MNSLEKPSVRDLRFPSGELRLRGYKYGDIVSISEFLLDEAAQKKRGNLFCPKEYFNMEL